jgi:polyphosphate kinase 2 (PPK2 family)
METIREENDEMGSKSERSKKSGADRSGVEPVMGFCSNDQTKEFLHGVPALERAMIESGILPPKYWLEINPDEQTRRLNDPHQIRKLSDMDEHPNGYVEPNVSLQQIPEKY